MSYVKEYVQVHLTVDEEGLVVPTSIIFHKEKKYDIESVTASIRAAATKVLGSGTRYTVVIKGQEKYLFEEAGSGNSKELLRLYL